MTDPSGEFQFDFQKKAAQPQQAQPQQSVTGMPQMPQNHVQPTQPAVSQVQPAQFTQPAQAAAPQTQADQPGFAAPAVTPRHGRHSAPTTVDAPTFGESTQAFNPLQDAEPQPAPAGQPAQAFIQQPFAQPAQAFTQPMTQPAQSPTTPTVSQPGSPLQPFPAAQQLGATQFTQPLMQPTEQPTQAFDPLQQATQSIDQAQATMAFPAAQQLAGTQPDADPLAAGVQPSPADPTEAATEVFTPGMMAEAAQEARAAQSSPPRCRRPSPPPTTTKTTMMTIMATATEVPATADAARSHCRAVRSPASSSR